MQLEQIIADLQNLIKKKPTLEEIGQSQGVSKQAISIKKVDKDIRIFVIKAVDYQIK